MDFLTNQNIQLYIFAYLLGSVPFGLILTKYFFKIDISKLGSKSIGATNVLRVLKEKDEKSAKKISILTLLFDISKSFFLILILKLCGFSDDVSWTVGIFSVMGHCFSIYLSFQGGKGVATALGVFLVLIPIQTLIAFFVWLFFIKVFKISSLASLFALFTVLLASYLYNISYFAPVCIISFMVFYKHIPNIFRIIKGKETKSL